MTVFTKKIVTLGSCLFVAGSVPIWLLLHAYHESLAWRLVTGTGLWVLASTYGEWTHHKDHCAGRRHP